MPKILKNRVFIFVLRRLRLEFPVIIYGNGGGAAGSLGCRRRRLSRSPYASSSGQCDMTSN